MEQFRQIGEVVGSLKALMVFQNNIFNQRQCCLLVDMLTSGYKTIAQQMKHNLRFEERNTKWKIIEHPLKELLRVFKEGETYIKQCLETKDWWAKAILLYQNADCVEFHIHNLLTFFPIVIEAIEMAGQISDYDQEEMQKKKFVYSIKYQKDMKDPRIFQWIFGEQYLVSQDFCNRLDSVWEEDRWFLLKTIKDKKTSGCLTSKRDRRLADVLLKYLNCSETSMDDVLLPSATLVNSKDYQVRRRLGNGSQYKEIQWLGESFALRHFYGDVETLVPDISKEAALSHPNILHILCAFTDEEKKECHLVMELMNRDLSSYIKEICGPRKRIPFTLPVAVDLMLQIARGMEYLHSKKIYHGELNPSNILIKARNTGTDGYLHAKVSGFGLSSSISSLTPRTPTSQNGQLPFIWHAPEVLAEQEQFGVGENSKHTEKSDVYSFGMICFELLTGKVPFEDTHLQGDKMSRNIRAGERPLFPFHSPKYITNLTKKCWHIDPGQRPSFSSICRILRYTKHFLVMNPEYSQPDAPMPPIDFSDLEAGMLRSIPSVVNSKLLSVSQIPFHMFVYRVMEREKANTSQRENYESGSEGTSTCGEEIILADDPLASPTERRSLPSPEIMIRKLTLSKRSLEIKTSKQPGTPKGRSVRPPHTPRTMRMNSESQLMMMSPRTRRTSGHVSDSELP
ncbi:mitogen-activated protein kinase kinase kinase 7 [Sesamum indicum]|uniref:Mitogen-activated protein kinase kinase kinase 7 n=1 Tax=Sesamum indicum TaxID=4182 RepID=A0A6I9U3A6_SESIN|nr:mitogen-activated protein kinase kinase kinase 7 [Sesamum indicum]